MLRKLTIAIVVLVVAAGGGLGLWAYYGRQPDGLSLPGVVEIQEVRLSSKVGGRVEKVAIDEGDLVRPGQPLVYFEAPELKTQLLQAQARLQSAQADLDKARNGARVEEKENARAALAAAEARWQRLKAGSRPEEIEQAQADQDSAEAEWKGAQLEWERVSRLFQVRATSRADYDAALATNNRLRGRLASARAKLTLLQAGSRSEDIAEAAAQMEQARASFDLLKAGSRSEDIAAAEAKVAELQARVEELKVNLKEAVVQAPEKAVVEVLAVRTGDLVAANQPVVRVLRADDLWVKVYVPETDLGRVRLRQKVDVTMDSYPGRRFEGTVQQIASASEFTPRNVQSADERRHQVFAIKVRVADPQGVFKSGMAATVWVPLHDLRGSD